MRYTARFTPEVWIRDQATEIDVPPGEPREWDCTRFAVAHERYLDEMAEQHGEQDGTVLDACDLFTSDTAMPEWVYRHVRSGNPFTIRVTRHA